MIFNENIGISDTSNKEVANATTSVTTINKTLFAWLKGDNEYPTEAQNNDMQTLADLLQRPVPDRDIKDFET